MNSHMLFLDTSYLIAIIVSQDTYNKKAKELNPALTSVQEIWSHEGILIELADWMADKNRQAALKWINLVKSNATNIKVIPLTSELIDLSLKTYEKYSDKTIGLTDCISFNIMWEKGINEALTSDNHFLQAGFRALLLE